MLFRRKLSRFIFIFFLLINSVVTKVEANASSNSSPQILQQTIKASVNENLYSNELVKSFNKKSDDLDYDKKHDLNNDNIIDIYDLVLLSKKMNEANNANIMIDKPFNIIVDESFSMTSSGESMNIVLYQYWVKDLSNEKWTLLREYSEDESFSWTPSKVGDFRIEVRIKGTKSTNEFDDSAYMDIYVHNPPISYVNSEKTLEEMIDLEFARSPYYGVKRKATKEEVAYYLNPDNFVNNDYGKYMFMKLSYMEGVKVSDLNKMLIGKGILEGNGETFLNAGKTHGVNPVYLISHALLETGNGTSKLCNGSLTYNDRIVYNAYGVGAIDTNPNYYGSKYAYEHEWFTIDDAIIGGAEFISKNYIQSNKYNSNYQDTLYKMRWNDQAMWHQYATDVQWAYNQIYNIKRLIDLCQDSFLYFEIPLYKNVE